MQDIMNIIGGTCCQFRKGESVVTRSTGAIDVVEVFSMPHIDEAPAHLEKVDVHFMVIGVDPDLAAPHKQDFIAIVEPHRELMERGPSFLTIAQEFEIEQDAAFAVMALGQAYGFWKVVTPAAFHLKGEMADRAAGVGYVMTSGYTTQERAA